MSIKADEFISHVKTIREDENFQTSFNVICDLRNASVEPGFLDVSPIADFIHNTHHQRGYFKFAILVSDKSRTGLDTLSAIADIKELAIDLKLFDSMEAAEKWVDSK